MDRIYRLMDELGSFYGRRSGYYGTWGHDRNDRDRDHDRDHDRYDRDRDHDNHDNGYRPPYPR
jgi:ABC-type Zn2+ transport system substrate-binding protein/surface adhesin